MKSYMKNVQMEIGKHMSLEDSLHFVVDTFKLTKLDFVFNHRYLSRVVGLSPSQVSPRFIHKRTGKDMVATLIEANQLVRNYLPEKYWGSVKKNLLKKSQDGRNITYGEAVQTIIDCDFPSVYKKFQA